MDDILDFDIDSVADAALRDYAKHGFEDVEGWGLNDFLAQLFVAIDDYQKQNAIGGNVFELGVYRGRVLILLALAARPEERAVGLDLFEVYQSQNVDSSGTGPEDGTPLALVEQNLARHGVLDRCDLIAADSLFFDFKSHPSLHDIRFAHLDGAHHVDAVVNDLIKTQQIIAPGAVVVVDDYIHSWYPGVREGCDRFLSFATPRLIIPFAVGGNKVFMTTHSHHERYLDLFRRILKEPMGRALKIHGYDAVAADFP